MENRFDGAWLSVHGRAVLEYLLAIGLARRVKINIDGEAENRIELTRAGEEFARQGVSRAQA